MPSFRRAVVLALGFASCANTLAIEMLADINQDGKIDSKDQIAKKADPNKAALFLANIGDTNRRCAQQWTDNQITWEQLEDCNDANGNELRNPDLVADVITSPCIGIGDDAIGVISSDKQEYVRIFHYTGSDWAFVDDKYEFKAKDLREGLKLGIDARALRGSKWDGNTKLTITIKGGKDGEDGEDGEADPSDFIHFQVAPVLTHHILQAPDEVFSMESGGCEDQETFVGALQEFTEKAGVRNKLVTLFTPDGDFWAQDFFKPGYTSIPGGPNGIKTLRVMMASAQDRPALHQQVFTRLRSKYVGAVLPSGSGGTIDSLGNLDTIPPFEFKGEKHPAGKPIMGVDGTNKPLMLKFLQDQGTSAVEIDSGWLLTKHVDEFIQFLPDLKGNRGWIMAVNDPRAGYNLLKEQLNQYGDFNAFSMKRPRAESSGSSDSSGSDSDGDAPTDPAKLLKVMTIKQLLAYPNLEKFNEYCYERIEKSISDIKAVTGIDDTRIVRIPVLYYGKKQQDQDDGKHIADTTVFDADPDMDFGKLKATSVFPNSINGLASGGTHILVPYAWGPITSEDVLGVAVHKIYTDLGFTVQWIDDFTSHFLQSGDVHCGTNMARDASQPWWPEVASTA